MRAIWSRPMAWYIALEGAEGCGKSTQAARLASRLDATLTRETGGTTVGQRIRKILHDTEVTHLSHRAEALLAAADRAQHLDEVVLPSLRGGRHVVSDRSVYSTLAYQGYGRGLDLAELRTLNDWAVSGRWPDVVVLLDASPDVLRERMQQRDLDRFEQAGDEFHERVRKGFAAMAADDPDRWLVIDANGSADAVTSQLTTAIDTWSRR
jgi:dTMP kinase